MRRCLQNLDEIAQMMKKWSDKLPVNVCNHHWCKLHSIVCVCLFHTVFFVRFRYCRDTCCNRFRHDRRGVVREIRFHHVLRKSSLFAQRERSSTQSSQNKIRNYLCQTLACDFSPWRWPVVSLWRRDLPSCLSRETRASSEDKALTPGVPNSENTKCLYVKKQNNRTHIEQHYLDGKFNGGWNRS